jgi:hypothetical protein
MLDERETKQPSTRFHRVTPIVHVADIDAGIDYYTRVLGVTLDWRDDDGNSFASVSRTCSCRPAIRAIPEAGRGSP